ncbi:hypothetical protein N7495_000397 [Penicillium taxi]|uniref:uncharacterized protein n=1 Tax=Penicillium taxi TaxID=168475 RepID=UPI0025459401|nr:uncharacterized protein N7495_000397 [Penicillium taxi]KAJ5907715.1 hypothetical protein N7495_000397 [Penicillium taxi]
MQFTTLFSVLASLSLSNAAALGKPSTWRATNWDIVCSGGCVYSFDISAAASEYTPGFNTHCEGISGNTTFCDNRNITATVIKQQHPLWKVTVKHYWATYEGHYYNRFSAAGSANVTESTDTFSINPNALYGA